MLYLGAGAPRTGLGDRMGVMLCGMTLAKLLNASFWLQWALTARNLRYMVNSSLSSDVLFASKCLQFPSFVMTLPKKSAAGRRTGTIIPHPHAGRTGHGNQQGNGFDPFNALPSLLGCHLNLTAVLPWTVSVRSYMEAYRKVAHGISLRASCLVKQDNAKPLAEMAVPCSAPSWEQPTKLAHLCRSRLRSAPLLYVHLRRKDRVPSQAALSKLEARTAHALRRLVAAAANMSSSWLVVSDSNQTAQNTVALLRRAAKPSQQLHAQAAPSELKGTLLFMSMQQADGIVQSSPRDSWSAFSSIPAHMFRVPLFSVTDLYLGGYDRMNAFYEASNESAQFFSLEGEGPFLRAAASRWRRRLGGTAEEQEPYGRSELI